MTIVRVERERERERQRERERERNRAIELVCPMHVGDVFSDHL